MKQFGKMMLLALGFGILAVVLSSLPNHPAAASGSAPVTVVGGVTGATPVPVSLQGTGNISGNVNAVQSGVWNVGVNNFPSTQPVSGTVNVGNFPSTQPVSFSNTVATPLYNRDVDNAAHNAFAQFLGCTVPAFAHSCSVNLSVPSGMELVIETVSVGGALNSGERAVVTMEFTTRGTSTNVLTLPLTFAGTFSTESPPDEYAVTQPLRVYADPATTVELDATTSDTTGGAGFHFEVSGYLVRCASGTGCPVP